MYTYGARLYTRSVDGAGHRRCGCLSLFPVLICSRPAAPSTRHFAASEHSEFPSGYKRHHSSCPLYRLLGRAGHGYGGLVIQDLSRHGREVDTTRHVVSPESTSPHTRFGIGERWEYMTIALEAGGFLGGKVNPDELTARLDEAGAAGWELVNVLTTAQNEGRTRDLLAVFERAK